MKGQLNMKRNEKKQWGVQIVALATTFFAVACGSESVPSEPSLFDQIDNNPTSTVDSSVIQGIWRYRLSEEKIQESNQQADNLAPTAQLVAMEVLVKITDQTFTLASSCTYDLDNNLDTRLTPLRAQETAKSNIVDNKIKLGKQSDGGETSFSYDPEKITISCHAHIGELKEMKFQIENGELSFAITEDESAITEAESPINKHVASVPALTTYVGAFVAKAPYEGGSQHRQGLRVLALFPSQRVNDVATFQKVSDLPAKK